MQNPSLPDNRHCQLTHSPIYSTSSTGRCHIALADRNDADRTTPIASAARGSVQSGFNDVAPAALGTVRVARPHRSLQIRCGLSPADQQAYDRSWPVEDTSTLGHGGHGTQLSGI